MNYQKSLIIKLLIILKQLKQSLISSFSLISKNDIVPSKVCFNIFYCCKACEYNFQQYKRKENYIFVKLIENYIYIYIDGTKYIIGITLLEKKMLSI